MHHKLDTASGGALPTDITPRTTIYRGRGIVASLLASLFAMGAPPRRSPRRRSVNAPPLSDELKRDIGLPIESPRSPAWKEIRF